MKALPLLVLGLVFFSGAQSAYATACTAATEATACDHAHGYVCASDNQCRKVCSAPSECSSLGSGWQCQGATASQLGVCMQGGTQSPSCTPPQVLCENSAGTEFCAANAAACNASGDNLTCSASQVKCHYGPDADHLVYSCDNSVQQCTARPNGSCQSNCTSDTGSASDSGTGGAADSGTGGAADSGTGGAADSGVGTPSTGNSLQNPLKNVSSLQDLLLAILGGVVMLGTIALVVALVWVGALFVFAQGAEEKIRDARNALMWTVIGGLVLLGAQSISIVIQNTVQSLQ